MNHRAIVAAILLFILIVAGMFVFAYLKRSELVSQDVTPVVEEPVTIEEPRIFERVEAKHFFADGKHTITGEVAMPTPCDLLDVNVAVLGNDRDRAIVSFNVINESEGQCAQVITPQRFKETFTAAENASIEGQLNGEAITLNLVEAGEDETLMISNYLLKVR